MVDIHLHSKFSFDSNEEPAAYVEAAKMLGADRFGFSEHYDYDAYLDGAKDVTLCDIASYQKSFKSLKTDGVDMLFGIEFGYRKEAIEHYNELSAKFRFDYVINSVHTLKGGGDCYHSAFFEGRPLEDAYRDYLKGVLESVTSNLDFDVVGHIGYVARYRKGENVRLCYSKYSDILDDILSAIIERGKCLEINTSSGTCGSRFLPDENIIERYLAIGGKLISFGSDAHRATDFMRKSSQLESFLSENGVKELIYFKDRNPIAYPISSMS